MSSWFVEKSLWGLGFNVFSGGERSLWFSGLRFVEISFEGLGVGELGRLGLPAYYQRQGLANSSSGFRV